MRNIKSKPMPTLPEHYQVEDEKYAGYNRDILGGVVSFIEPYKYLIIQYFERSIELCSANPVFRHDIDGFQFPYVLIPCKVNFVNLVFVHHDICQLSVIELVLHGKHGLITQGLPQ